MSEPLTQDTLARCHRTFAVECNNRAWELSAQAQRTRAEDREMLFAAYAAAFHWGKIGTVLHHARAELTLAHVHALLGHGELAMAYAQHCLAFVEHNDCEDWDIAFAHAELAHAAAVMGDAKLHAQHYMLAKTQGEAIEEEEDRRIFLEELARIPSSVVPRA